MNIRFNAFKNYNTQVSSVNNVDSKASGTKSKNVSAGKTDTVSISATASDFSSAKVITDISSNVNGLSNNERVSSIKEQVKNGTYNVSSQAVADSILDRFAWFL